MGALKCGTRSLDDGSSDSKSQDFHSQALQECLSKHNHFMFETALV